MELFDPTGGVLAGGGPILQATGIILDNDGSTFDRSLFVSDPIIIEGDSGNRQALFEVRISEPSSSTLNFAYTTANGSAVAGEDFIARSGFVTFNPGQTVETVRVDLIEDTIAEGTENFSLIVTPDGSIANGVADAGGLATILDDDTSTTLPEISIIGAEAQEGELAVFTVTLSEPSPFADVTVQFRTRQDGTSTEETDHSFFSGTLTFMPGQTVGTISIDTDDNLSLIHI